MKIVSRTYFFLICFVVLSLSSQAQANDAELIRMDIAALENAKNHIKEHASAYEVLLKSAAKSLKFGPYSVMDKKDVPPSGTKHDYMSVAPYWWPDPSKPNGTPYIRRDGEINPEVANYTDKTYLPALCQHVYILSLAYYLSGDETYANHAAKLVKVWFLEDATKMNPQLNYGQSVKGVTDGRPEGIIETRHFMFLVDGLTLLKSSPNWNSNDEKMMKQWFSAYLSWMQSSTIGIGELTATNNHGVWFDAQAISLATYIDSISLAKKIGLRTIERLNMAMKPDGSFPEEMARTTSLHYSVFNMQAFIMVAEVANKVGLDLWHVTTPSGNSLKKGFDFLMPYITKEKTWTSKQIKEFNMEEAYPLLFQSAYHYDCSGCIDIVKKNEGEAYNRMLINLIR